MQLKLIRVSTLDFEFIKEQDKVKSLISHADGIVLSKDETTQELEIAWTSGQETSTTRNHISKLGSVIYLG